MAQVAIEDSETEENYVAEFFSSSNVFFCECPKKKISCFGHNDGKTLLKVAHFY